ncbi:MAG: nickel-dependent lactate racemase [Pirellulales bacterium]|nr:nickel-dependent lactate racemase [Pirellulales bacterium]
MNYTISYGKRKLSLQIPRKRVIGQLSPKDVKQVADVGRAVRNALKRPFESPPLVELLQGRTTALIVTVDHTRPSPKPMLDPMLEACAACYVTPTIMIATGRHRQMTPQELKSHLGSDILNRYRIEQHDPFDSRRMITKGKTKRGTVIRVNRAVFEHDIVLGCGIIEPSYLAGWSGGRKLLMPGLAHHKSIDNNHYYLTHQDAKIGRLHGNPISDDAAECAAKLPLHFILYALSGPNDEVMRVIAGHPVKAHKRACKLCERVYRIPAKHADIVISSAGGHPYDCDLVQTKKAIIPAIETVKRNGVIILCGQCPDGLGAEETFVRWLKEKTPAQVVHDVRDRKQFSLGAHGANILARPIVEKNAKVILVTGRKVSEQLAGTYVTAVTRLADAWKLANLITGPQSDVLLIENARRLIVH